MPRDAAPRGVAASRDRPQAAPPGRHRHAHDQSRRAAAGVRAVRQGRGHRAHGGQDRLTCHSMSLMSGAAELGIALSSGPGWPAAATARRAGRLEPAHEPHRDQRARPADHQAPARQSLRAQPRARRPRCRYRHRRGLPRTAARGRLSSARVHVHRFDREEAEVRRARGADARLAQRANRAHARRELPSERALRRPRVARRRAAGDLREGLGTSMCRRRAATCNERSLPDGRAHTHSERMETRGSPST